MSQDALREFNDNRGDYSVVPIAAFTAMAREERWADGPWRDSFGSGYGEPYQPNRDVWGTLADGRKVCSVT